MPSLFPGMDPFLEHQVSHEFHQLFTVGIAEVLVPALRPRYVARIEERVYLQYEPRESSGPVRPDVTVLRETSPERGGPRGGTAVLTEPLLIPLPMPEEVKEAYLEVWLRETHEVIAVIEVLSPSNKRAGSEGQREYLAKREAVLRSRTHLVEIDLLRGGDRMPTAKPLPPCDYVALVSRGNRRPMASVWAFTLRHRLPVIPIPLAGQDPDVPLDLQEVFNRVYDRAGYDYSIDYATPLELPLAAADQEWAAELIADTAPAG